MNHQYLHCQQLIHCLYQQVRQCFSHYPKNFFLSHDDELFAEHYKMEREIFSWMVREILQTGEYTIEGIAHHTRLPLDIISDAAMGLQKDISMTLWTKIAGLFLEIKNRGQNSGGDG